MNNKPLVSVVMPVFNAEKFVGQAIESILNQTLINFEFIIVNDASTDKTLQIVRRFEKKDKRIKLINNKKNLQMANSINLGIDQAKSDIIARMDGDDIALPDRLKVQYSFLQLHPEIVIVGNDITIIDEHDNVIGKRTYPTTSHGLKRIMLRYSPFAHPTIMFKKDVFQKLGGYDFKKDPCDDIEFWFRLGREYAFASIPKILLKYRISTTSISHHNVRSTELIGFSIKLDAIQKYGYRPSLYDIVYNILQFTSAWFMPAGMRIRLYNALRSRNLI